MNKISEQTLITLIDQLRDTHLLSKEEWTFLIENRTRDVSEYLFSQAREVRHRHYGHDVYIRGLIEFTNYCKNDCIYCGIRKSNPNVCRYRLREEDILNCCRTGYELGFRTFVLQGGEDGWFTDQKIVSLIEKIKSDFPDCAITLSIGEKERASYQAFFDAGADRYLLRHETYNSAHYGKLHPASLTAAHRQRCLYDLKEIGYQTGTGFMVGSPYQTAGHLAEDMLFIQKLNPHMVGIVVYPAPRYPICRTACRHAGTDLIYARTSAADDPKASAAFDNRAWDDRSKRKRTRYPCRGKCRHAKPFSDRCAKRLCTVRQQDLHRR